jgi:REase_MTES_1575
MQTRGYRRSDASTDELIARFAVQQHGVVSRAQLVAAGVGREAIRHRLATSRLHLTYPTVYAVGHPLLSLHGRYLAAVLACGDHAVLSHRDAATLLDLLPVGSGAIEVTTIRRGRRSLRGIKLHSSRSLPPDEITTCEGIPCTTVARTLVDLAGCVPPRRLRQTLEQALVLRVFDLAATTVALGRARGRRGTAALRRLLAEVADEPPLTRRELERLFRELVREAGLPLPVVNGLVAGYEVDFHWPAHRLIVETDGRAFHAHALAFDDDRQRDLDLELAGWHVLRVTWRHVLQEPERVVALLRSRLG